MQHWHLDELFSSLDSFVNTLSQTNAPSGNTLIDEVTIVVFSEMVVFHDSIFEMAAITGHLHLYL